MSEYKGSLFATIIFGAFILPGLLMLVIAGIQQQGFIKTTNELTQLTKEEAGVSEKVASAVNNLHEKGYEISFTDGNGETVTTTLDYGEEVNIDYDYYYNTLFGERNLQANVRIPIMKRDGEGSGQINDPSDNAGDTASEESEEEMVGESHKTIELVSDETTNQDQTKTFRIPGLENIINIESDTGSVEVVDINGEEVTLEMSGGKVYDQELVGGEYIPGERKYVTGEESPYYNDDGYSGELHPYISNPDSYTFIPGHSKYVTNQLDRYYDQNGYTGILDRFLYSGTYVPSDTKYVTQQPSPYYDDVYGYSGFLDIYLYDTEYRPEQTKWVSNYHQQIYDEDGFYGVLDEVSTLDNIASVSAGGGHTVFVTESGDVYAVGDNSYGQLGDGTNTSSNTLVKVQEPWGNKDVIDVSAGENHTLFLLETGEGYTVGSDDERQLGQSREGLFAGTRRDQSTPVRVGEDADYDRHQWSNGDIIDVSGGSSHTAFLLGTGHAYVVGQNNRGQIGHGDTINSGIADKPTSTDEPWGNAKVTAVEAGFDNTFFLLETGEVYATGDNQLGQLGVGYTNDEIDTPEKVDGPWGSTDVIDVAAGQSHAAFLLETGEVYAAGDAGKLGDGTNTGSYTPVKVNEPWGNTDVIEIEAGRHHTLFLLETGEVYATGNNRDGQLGDGTTTDKNTPVKMQEPWGNASVVDMAGGHWHTILLLDTGAVYAVGDNSSGQLGDGTTISRTTPVPISSGSAGSGSGSYEGYVTRPEQETEIVYYRGNVTRPTIDNREYRYRGYVNRPITDTREWKYEGWVTKPGVDTREYEDYYKYHITIEYETK